MAFTKFELLTSPSFEKIRILSILFLTTQRDPRKFPASTAVPVLAFPSSYLKVSIVLSGAESPPEKDSLLRFEVNIKRGSINQSINIFIFVSKYFSMPANWRHSKAQFRRRTFHDPNLIPWIKYMKSSTSKSVKNGYLNLERLSRSFRLAQPGISPLERFWFRRWTFHVPNLMQKLS